LSIVYFRFAARAAQSRERSPLLEQLLARADDAGCVTDWRAQAFRVIAPEAKAVPPIATAALRVGSDTPSAGWVCVATPVHYEAGMSSVGMPEDGVLNLELPEADALAVDFNRVFDGAGMRLTAGRKGLLLCLFDTPLRVTSFAPEEVLGRDIWAFLPSGPDSARVRALMSEIEMWLFEHAANEQRKACSVPVISALWLWGGGPADALLPAVHGWTAGDDPLFMAFGARPEYPGAAEPGVVTIVDSPGTPGWRVAEQRWLEPAYADLRLGRLKRLDLSAGNRCFNVSARATRRFWRRSRPWWEYFHD
jgi:hypothetical protein